MYNSFNKDIFINVAEQNIINSLLFNKNYLNLITKFG